MTEAQKKAEELKVEFGRFADNHSGCNYDYSLAIAYVKGMIEELQRAKEDTLLSNREPLTNLYLGVRILAWNEVLKHLEG